MVPQSGRPGTLGVARPNSWANLAFRVNNWLVTRIHGFSDRLADKLAFLVHASDSSAGCIAADIALHWMRHGQY